MNETANALLALGALPVMAHAREEVEEMVGLAGALAINIGTLSPPWVDAMLAAGKGGERARDPGRPRPGRGGRDRVPDGDGAADPRRGRRDGAARQRGRGRDARRGRGRGARRRVDRRRERPGGARPPGGPHARRRRLRDGPGRPRLGRGARRRRRQRARDARDRDGHGLHVDRDHGCVPGVVGRPGRGRRPGAAGVRHRRRGRGARRGRPRLVPRRALRRAGGARPGHDRRARSR